MPAAEENSPSHEQIDAQASEWMKRGITRMADNGREAIDEALRYFDSAIELRNQLPIDEAPLYRYGLAACWLNRAEARMRLDDPSQFSIALRDCEQGIQLLRGLSLDQDARFPRRLVIALQNRGLLLFAQRRIAEGIDAFGDAIDCLVSDSAQAIPDRRYLLGAAYLNLALANAEAADPVSESAANDAATKAMNLAIPTEANDPASAEIGIKARHLLCRLLTARLGSATSEEVHQSSDLADDALSLVQLWEKRGITRFRGLAYDLFRFGARLYGTYQPHFLNEFIRDQIDPARSSQDYVESPEVRAAFLEITRSVPQ